MMKFNATMGTSLVPLIARLVLCAAFITTGWNKLMNDHEFHGEDAQLLIDLGVVQRPAAGGALGRPAALIRVNEQAAAEPADQATNAQPQQDEPAPDAPQPPAEPEEGDEDIAEQVQDAAEDIQEDVEEAVEDVLEDLPEPPADEVVEDSPDGELVVSAKRMHSITLLVERNGWPRPVTQAWLVTLAELIGGALLLIGLFSRIWALGLVIVMAVAFCMTSWPVVSDMGLFAVAADMEGGYAHFHRMYAQLGLFALAFGVLLAGAGSISLDRLLFRPSHRPRKDDDDEY